MSACVRVWTRAGARGFIYVTVCGSACLFMRVNGSVFVLVRVRVSAEEMLRCAIMYDHHIDMVDSHYALDMLRVIIIHFL